MKLLRACLGVVALVILGWRVVNLWTALDTVASTTSVVGIPYNDAVEKGVELLVQQADSWAQATTLLLAAVAALWIAKGDEPRLALKRRLWPEIAMWVAGVLMLGAGLYCHNEYLAGIASALETGGVTSGQDSIRVPNVFDDRYEVLRAQQLWLLVLGSTASVLAVFSVRNLAEWRDAST